jgi:hypothetical protein
MRELMEGNRGAEVRLWQTFLRGRGLYLGKVDGIFGPLSLRATKDFQASVALRKTGVVDDATFGAAVRLGLPLTDQAVDALKSPDWPKPPSREGMWPLTQEGRQNLFGKFRFKASPTVMNPEAITILDSWVKDNIVNVSIRRNATQYRTVQFHRTGAARLVALFDAWHRIGLLDRIKSWDGTWVPRFIRGSRTTLSSHAWGTAFDINARWNYLGAVPAIVGAPGCVRELVETANTFGFFWGGHFPQRKDGMHFELVSFP